jgi:hypothetical protein
LGYFVAEQSIWPALLPAMLGLALLISGLLGLKQAFRKNAMHAAVLLALLGLAGTARAVFDLVELVLKQRGPIVESATAAVCAVFLWLAIRSFIEARRRPVEAVEPAGEQRQEEKIRATD